MYITFLDMLIALCYTWRSGNISKNILWFLVKLLFCSMPRSLCKHGPCYWGNFWTFELLKRLWTSIYTICNYYLPLINNNFQPWASMLALLRIFFFPQNYLKKYAVVFQKQYVLIWKHEVFFSISDVQ